MKIKGLLSANEGLLIVLKVPIRILNFYASNGIQIVGTL
jgi:hypothetical protein